MNYNEFITAVEDAENTQRRADIHAEAMAKMLIGRLRKVTRHDTYSQHNILADLKRELSNYNASTRQWKS